MSLRRVLRIVLSLTIIALLWWRTALQWHERSGAWLAGSLTLSVLLLLVVIVEITGAQRKWSKQRDDVPKRPLGLDS